MLPGDLEATVECRLLNLTTDIGLHEYAVGHTKKDAVTLYLYATMVTRVLECRHVSEADHQHDMRFTYHAYYLNISHVDVEAELERIRERYRATGTVFLWKYNKEYVYLLHGHEVDQYGLSETPIDNSKDVVRAWLAMKLLVVVASGLVTLLVVLLYSLASRYRVTIQRLCAPLLGLNGSVLHSVSSSRNCV